MLDLPIINTKDDLKAAKKVLSALEKKIYKVATGKQSKPLSELAHEAVNTYDYHDKTPIKSALWNLFSIHPFCNGLTKFPEYIATIKEQWPAVAELAETFWLLIKEDVEDYSVLRIYLDEQAILLKGGNPAIRALSDMAKGDSEKRLALMRYSQTLKGWKESEIVDGKLVINGKVTDEEKVFCGVRIGNGIRVHGMYVSVCTDEKTSELFIGARNLTQWYRSGLFVIDLWENVPEDVRSER